MTVYIRNFISSSITLGFSFFPILLLVFGSIAAGISGYIEYQVLNDLYPDTIFIPYLVVVIESCKVILIFNYGTSSDSKSASISTLIRNGFIVLSIYCSAIYSIDKLNAPNEAIVMNAAVLEIEEDRNSELIRLDALSNKVIFQQTKQDNIRLDLLYAKREKEKDNTFKGSKEYQGPKYKGYTQEIESLDRSIQLKAKDIQEYYNTQIEEVRIRSDSVIELAKKSSRLNTNGGSEILLASLSLLGEGNMANENHYIINIVMLSLLLVFILEGLIYYTFCSLAEEYGTVVQMGQEHAKRRVKGDFIRDDINEIYSSAKKNEEGYLNSRLNNIYRRIQKYHQSVVKDIRNYINN